MSDTPEIIDIPTIIDFWPNCAELARRIGVEPVVVQRWRSRKRIPGKYDLPLVHQAQEDGIELTFEMIANARANSHSDQDGRAVARSKVTPSSILSTCGEQTTSAA